MMFDYMLSAHTLLTTLIICLLVQTICWLVQCKTKNTDIIDIAWASLIVICGLIYFIQSANHSLHRYIILLLPVAWYMRLSWHLINRYQVSQEDGRYKQLRQYWKSQSSEGIVQLKMLAFFLFQGLLAWGFSIPAYLVAEITVEISLWDYLAILIAVIALVGVTLSDNQLRNFKKKNSNKGLVCSDGFWRYSRHPNYFFEWLHWISYPLLAFNSHSLLDPSWWLLASYPFWMLIFLLKLTGIPFNEEQNIRTKGDAYKEYQNCTNMFFLGKPKNRGLL